MSNGNDELNAMFEAEGVSLTPAEIKAFGASRSQQLGEAMQAIGIKASTQQRVQGVLSQTISELSQLLPSVELGLRALTAQSFEEIKALPGQFRDVIGLPETQSLEDSVIQTIGDDPSVEQQRLLQGQAEFIGGAG